MRQLGRGSGPRLLVSRRQTLLLPPCPTPSAPLFSRSVLLLWKQKQPQNHGPVGLKCLMAVLAASSRKRASAQREGFDQRLSLPGGGVCLLELEKVRLPTPHAAGSVRRMQTQSNPSPAAGSAQ